MRKPLVSLIIPTYNERENILSLIPELKRITATIPRYRFEAILIDDDSPDGTGTAAAEAFSADPFLRIFIRKRVRGLGTAIGFGIRHALGEIIIGMDADFNHDPSYVPSLLKALQKSDLVITSRFAKGGGMDDRLRYWGTYLFNLFLHLVLSFPVTDNFSGYYAVRLRDLKRLDMKRIYRGYGDYHLRLVWYAKQKGFTFSEVPVYYRHRRYGQSKSHLFAMAISYTKEALRLRLEDQNTPSV